MAGVNPEPHSSPTAKSETRPKAQLVAYSNARDTAPLLVNFNVRDTASPRIAAVKAICAERSRTRRAAMLVELPDIDRDFVRQVVESDFAVRHYLNRWLDSQGLTLAHWKAQRRQATA